MSSIKDISSNIKQYWRKDILAGFSVSLVALPLSLGIAIAMNLPPEALLAGIFAASLELTKEGIVSISQKKSFEELMIKKYK